MIGVLVFIVSNIALVLAAGALAEHLSATREPWRKLLAWVCAYGVLAIAINLVLGLLGMLWAVAIALTALALYAGCRWGIRSRHVAIASGVPGAHGGWEPYAAAGLLSASAGWIGFRALFAGTEFSTDDLIYHAPIVAHWIQDRALSFAPAGYSAYYPQNAELFAIWFVVPFGADGYASLAGLYWAALGALAVAILCRLLGCRLSTALIVGAMFLGSSVVDWSARTFSAVDLIGPGAILAATAFAVPPLASDTHRHRMIDAALAGLMAGVAVGSKVPFASAAFILFVYFGCARSGPGGLARLQVLSAFLIAALLTGSYWYWRNLALTANPIYPASLGPLTGPFGPMEQQRTTLIYWLLNDWRNVEMWAVVVRYLKWGYGLGLLSAAGFIAALVHWIRYRTTAQPFGLLLSIGLVSILTYPFMPFSGTWDGPLQPLVALPRYVILPFAIGLVLCAMLTAQSWRRTAFIGAATLALIENWVRGASPGLSLFAHGVLALAGVACLWVAYHPRTRAALVRYDGRRVILSTLLSVLLALGLYSDRKQTLTDQNIYAYGKGANKQAGEAWQTLSQVPPNSIVAAFGPDMWMYYPLFGRRYELRPHPATINGDAYAHLHARPPTERVWWWHERVQWQPDRFIETLRSHGVQYVLIAKGGALAWPEQHHMLRAQSQAQMVYATEGVQLWTVKREDTHAARPER